MTYEFRCNRCDKHFEITKPVAQYNDPEYCISCGEIADRIISAPAALLNTAVTGKYWSHGLGQIVNSRQHEKKLAKEKGLIELGNDKPKHEPRRQKYEL